MSAELPRVTGNPSIHDVVRAHLDPAGRLTDPDLSLPDDGATFGMSRWAPGALDGVLSAGPTDATAEQAAHIAMRFVKACAKPSLPRLVALYSAVSDDEYAPVQVVDQLIDELGEQDPDLDALHDLAHWLVTTGTDRNAVKIGLSVLGATGLDEEDGDLDVVRALGAHDEFTLFAAVALVNGLAEAESELWALAVAVEGWGRIQCVQLLCDTEDPEIRSWILRHGFRNSIMHEYTAYVAATTGGLLDALRAETVDRELLTAAGEILQALLVGGPVEDIDDYAEGADAVEAFLQLMTVRARTLTDLNSVGTIRVFLADEDADWDARATQGWTTSRREAFEAHCTAIMDRPEWPDRIAVTLLSDDQHEFMAGSRAARQLGIDTFDAHVQRIREDPLGPDWAGAWHGADRTRAELLADLARELLPLNRISIGAAEELGVGRRWRPHHALAWTLQALRRYPGVGADLVLAALRSPVTSNRLMAVRALGAWTATDWPAGAAALLAKIADGDPYPKVRESAAEVLDR